MGITANGLVYPELTDAPNGPGAVQGLALKVDERYGGTVPTFADTADIDPFLGMRVWCIAEETTATYVGDSTWLRGDWQAYTPVWTASGGGLANYVGVGWWKETDDGLVDVWARLTAHASGFNNGGGSYSVTLPAEAHGMGTQLLKAECYDSSAGNLYSARGRVSAGDDFAEIFCPPTTAGGPDRNVSNAVPFAWANSDVLTVDDSYRRA